MEHVRRLFCMGVLVCAVIGLMNGSAIANVWSVIPAGEVTLTSTEPMLFTTGYGVVIPCEVRLTMSLPTSVREALGTDLGSVTRIESLPPAEEGEEGREEEEEGRPEVLCPARGLQVHGRVITLTFEERSEERPWRIQYNSRLGVFPDRLTGLEATITGVRFLLRTQYQYIPACVYRGSLRALFQLRYSRETEEGPRYSGSTVSVSGSFGQGGYLYSEEIQEGVCAIVSVAGTFAISPEQTWTHDPIDISDPIDFGRIDAERLAKREVTITVATTTRIEDIRVNGGRVFALTDPRGCRGSSLAARGSCTFTAVFVPPGERGRAYVDEVIVETDRGRNVVAVRGATN